MACEALASVTKSMAIWCHSQLPAEPQQQQLLQQPGGPTLEAEIRGTALHYTSLHGYLGTGNTRRAFTLKLLVVIP